MTLVDVTNGCCGLSWRDIFARLAAGILLRERSTGGVVHIDIVDGEGEPMLRLKTEIECVNCFFILEGDFRCWC